MSSSQHSAAEKKAILESYKGKELSENKKAADKLAAKRTKYETKYNDTNKERYKKKAERIKGREELNNKIGKYIKTMSYEDMRAERAYATKVAAGGMAVQAIFLSPAVAAVNAPSYYRSAKNQHRVNRINAQSASKHSAAEKKAGQRQSSNVRVSYNRNVAKNVDPFYIPSAERKKMRKEMDRLNKKISADPNKASKKDAERFLVLYTAMQNHEKVKKQVESHSRKKR